MKRLMLASAMLAVTATVWVVARGTPQHDDQPATAIQTIDLDMASALYEGGRRVLFIDARRDADFKTACIPGAVLLDYYNPEPYLGQVRAQARDVDRIVVYCNGDGCGDSFNTAYYLCREIDEPLDVRKVMVFEGGIAEWCAAGMPVVGMCPVRATSQSDNWLDAGDEQTCGAP